MGKIESTEEVMPVETETKKEKDVFRLVEVTTQTAPAIQTPSGELITDSQAIILLLNKVEEIKNLVG